MKAVAYFSISLLILFSIGGCGLKEIVGPNAENYTRSDSYQPVTAGSVWKYNVNALGVTDVKTVTMQSTTATFDGRTYAVAQVTQKSDPAYRENEYYYHSGTVYTNRTDATAPDDIVELQYLDDTAIIGTEFVSKPNALGTNGGNRVRWVGKIIDRNATRDVGKLSFKNVIRTKVDYQVDSGSGFVTNSTYEYFVSRGVGIIEMNISANGVVIATQQITNYNIR